MRRIRGIAGFLYYLTRIIAMIYSAIALYAIIVLLVAKITGSGSVPMTIDQGKFVIYWPFTHAPFLLGDYANTYLIPMLLAVVFYAVFFWLLSGVFHSFRQRKLFVQTGVTRLKRFYLCNFFMPVIILLSAVVYGSGDVQDFLMITVLHAIIGVFALFMAAIFTQGLLLQEEQDLTL